MLCVCVHENCEDAYKEEPQKPFSMYIISLNIILLDALISPIFLPFANPLMQNALQYHTFSGPWMSTE